MKKYFLSILLIIIGIVSWFVLTNMQDKGSLPRNSYWFFLPGAFVGLGIGLGYVNYIEN